MVITQILGGLGNQLSAYACGYSIAKYLGQELVLDVSDYTHKGYIRPYCLDKLQIGVHRKLIYPPASIDFMDESCIPKELKDDGLRIVKHEDYKTREELLAAVEGAENVYLLGYGGMHYCTPEEQKEVINQFQLKKHSTAVEQFKERIHQEYSVAVHLRRTDFVKLCGIQTPDTYYQAAITYVKIFYPDAHFYFFSDDIEYAKKQFGSCKNYHYVHILGGMDADLDEFFCISACNGRILTRQSSFSAWATKLSRNKNQINICQEYESRDWEDNGQIYLNQAAIGILSSHYHAETSHTKKESCLSHVNDFVFQLVSKERNDEAIEQIDQVSLDSYSLTEADTQELTVFKTIALAQKADGLLPALRTFYMQMQTEYENPIFHANYFRALYQSNCIIESAIHAALANRFGDSENYQDYFAHITPFGQKLYQLLRYCPVRHFIFVPH